MSKLAKFQRFQKLAKKAGEFKHKSKDAMGEIARDAGELATHLALGVATKNTPDGLFGVKWLRFDYGGAVLTGLGMLFTKGKWRKGFRATFKGSLHAICTSWLMKTEIKVINGPDGARFV